MTQAELFQAATVVTLTTGKHALKELLSAGLIQRIGGGGTGIPFGTFEVSPAGTSVRRCVLRSVSRGISMLMERGIISVKRLCAFARMKLDLLREPQ
jgi:hypothetical protein